MNRLMNRVKLTEREKKRIINIAKKSKWLLSDNEECMVRFCSGAYCPLYGLREIGDNCKSAAMHIIESMSNTELFEVLVEIRDIRKYNL